MPTIVYMHQTSGACAGVCTWDPTHEMGKTVMYQIWKCSNLTASFCALWLGRSTNTNLDQ